MYVLDRLLALQLGRPVAIYEADFAVILPSRKTEIAFDDTDSEEIPTRTRLGGEQGNRNNKEDARKTKEIMTDQETSIMDYFLYVIQFSHILGQVMRELYHPTQVESSAEDMRQSTSFLDKSLSAWKPSLPHHLRFDLRHTIEKSVTFKRQVRHNRLMFKQKINH